MSGVDRFISKRQPFQPDPRRQALGNQSKVSVPATRLGNAETRSITPQPSHSSRLYAKDVRQPESQLAQTSNSQGDLFDTDAEGIDDTTVTSVGNSSGDQQSSMQGGNHALNSQKSGGSNGFAARANAPLATDYGQLQGHQRLDRLEGDDVTLDDDDDGYTEDSGDDQVNGEGEEDGSTEEDDSQEYLNPGIHGYQRRDLDPEDNHQIMASPTMQNARTGGLGSQNPVIAFSAQMTTAQKLKTLGIRSNRPEQPTSQSFQKQVQGALYQTYQGRPDKQRVTSDQPAALIGQTVPSNQRNEKQGLSTPPPTSSKPAAPQRKLAEERQEGQPSSAIESQTSSLPLHTGIPHGRTNHDTKQMDDALTIEAQHEMMPPPGYRKASAMPGSHRDREVTNPQRDAIEDKSASIDGQRAGLSHDDDFTHKDRGADDEGSVTRKHARDLDHTPNQLSAMTFEQLSSEPFNHDPKDIASTLPEEIASGTLTDKIDHMLKLDERDTKDIQRKAILSSLLIEEYKECGDLIVGRFGKIITKFSDARQQRREILMRFEAEVAKRESRVRCKMGAVEKDLGRLKRGGEDVVRGKPDE